MSDPGWLGYLLIFVSSAVLTTGLVPVMLRVARARGILDHPGGYKVQRGPTPYLGGAAIALAFCSAVAVAALIRPPTARGGEVWAILAVAATFAVTGLIDDLRSLSPWPRLVVVVLGALALYSAGVRTDLADGHVVDVVVTVFWVAGITNAMNLLDNMDGLSAGIAGIASATFSLLAMANGQYLVASLGLALAGAAVAFLRHNRPPARIYMGDAGSLFLGVLLAVLGLKLRFVATPPQIAVLVPILVMGIAILDTCVVVVTRLANGRNPLRGGRDHLSHRLVHVGVSVTAAVSLLYGAALGLSGMAVVMSRLRDTGTAYLLFGLVLTACLLVGVLVGTVPVYGQSRRHLQFTEPQSVSENEQPDAPGARLPAPGDHTATTSG